MNYLCRDFSYNAVDLNLVVKVARLPLFHYLMTFSFCFQCFFFTLSLRSRSLHYPHGKTPEG